MEGKRPFTKPSKEKTMKAIVCDQPGQFRLREMDAPKPKAGEALVRMVRVGVCGTDLHAYRGRHPLVTYPRILGHELSGEIVAVNEPAHGLKVGDPVVILPYLECGKCIACRHGKPNCCMSLKVYGVHLDGGMAEFLNVPTDHLIKAENLSFDEMAMVECLSIGAHAVFRARIQPGTTAMIIGAGPIGLGAIQFAKAAGAKVLAADTVPERLNFCRTHLQVDYAIQVKPDWAKEVEAVTDKEYPLTVLDATGNVQSMNAAFNLVAHGGTLVFVGLVKENISFSDADFHRHELTVMSSRNATRRDLEQVIQAIRAGKASGKILITHRAKMNEVIARFESWLQPETGVVKALIEF
jgi:2-desacetyl-2-hydroxyethyl bacteriochlorophyllide A dehydrogenase